ncbi:MAG: 5'/3'-nucleotidase SurE [Sphingobacteriia bacterium]|jgi:5'-nucleotidase|nr:5'/3'-nucleotidase SurE [Sphingobacteriia bacterium]
MIMVKKKPLILITNDDGITSKGIAELITMARQFGDVVVVAPDGPRSAQSNALTVEVPLYFEKLPDDNTGSELYKCSGTPTDCVKLALNQVLDRKPDLLLAGINHGSNAAVSVIYSGTMGAVFEGCINRIPAIGLSICDHRQDADFSMAIPYFSAIVRKFMEHPLEGICLNVNAPIGEIKGVKVCRQTKGYWAKEFEPQISPNGNKYFWLTGYFVNLEPNDSQTDEWALANGFISVVPTHVDMTAYNVLNDLTTQGYEEI